MALVGVLSTGLIHEALVRSAPGRIGDIPLATLVDRSDSRSTE